MFQRRKGNCSTERRLAHANVDFCTMDQMTSLSQYNREEFPNKITLAQDWAIQ